MPGTQARSLLKAVSRALAERRGGWHGRAMPIALALALLAPPPDAGQTVTSRPTIVSPSDRRPAPAAQPTATMVAAPVAMAIAGFDADGDGRTSRAELTAGVARSFASIDTGHAGTLRYLDYADWALRYLGDRNALPSPFEADTNGDDTVSLAEVQAAVAAVFDRLDTDRDGQASRAELLTIRDGRGPDDGRRGGKRPPR